MAVDPTRRGLFAASAAALPLLLSACKGVQALGTPPPPPADVRLLRAAISAEEQMVARYRGALAAASATSVAYSVLADLTDVQTQHMAHLAQLSVRLIEPTVRPSRPSHLTLPITGSLSAVLAELELAEQSASDRLIGQLAAAPPSLAQLLASIAASEATHAEFLRAVRRGG